MIDSKKNDQLIISVDTLYKNFGKLEVLKGISCQINKGEIVAIIGPSGSGKATFLRCMNLLEEPTYGEIWFKDKLLTDVDPYLHFDIIKKSNTYKKMVAENGGNETQDLSDAIIIDIKKNDLLKRHEGKEFKEAEKEFYKEHHQDVNFTRRKMGMVFQHFNLFNNLTVLQNLMLAPVQLKIKTKEQAEEKAFALLKRIGLEDKANVYP